MGFDDDRDATKYHGFKVHWDRDANGWVFDSKDERDRWQLQQYGHVRNGFREPEEPLDERRATRFQPKPDWTYEEEMRYLRAVRALPIKEYGHMTPYQYMAATCEVANGLRPSAPVKAMPERADLAVKG